jgi:hypothetical protein
MANADLGGGLKYRVERRNGSTWLALMGHITEAADFTSLKSLPAPLVIDLSGVDRINSLGVRGWIDFVHEVEATGHTLAFEKAPPIIVGQMSMILNFMGNSRVNSVLTPYVCPKCSTEHLELVDVGEGRQPHFATSMPCPKCKAEMEFDDVLEMYTELFVRG